MSTKRVAIRALVVSTALAGSLFAAPATYPHKPALIGTALATTADQATLPDVPYVDETGADQTCSAPQPLAADTAKLQAGWYVATGDVTLGKQLTVEGAVNLILADNSTLTLEKGLSFAKDATLRLYAQRAETGRLVVLDGIKTDPEDERNKIPAEEQDIDAGQGNAFLAHAVCAETWVGDSLPPTGVDGAAPDPAALEDFEYSLTKTTVLTKDLFAKKCVRIRPLAKHKEAEADGWAVCENCGHTVVQGDGEFATLQVDGLFDAADPLSMSIEGSMLATSLAGSRSLAAEAAALADTSEQPDQAPALSAAAEDTIATITFDANGGFGNMDPMQVVAGETFTLPECIFDPPEGKVFDSWSLGKPGSHVSVPASTTVRAWWKNASTGSGTEGSGSQTDSGSEGSSSGSNSGGSAQSGSGDSDSSSGSNTSGSGSSTDGSNGSAGGSSSQSGGSGSTSAGQSGTTQGGAAGQTGSSATNSSGSIASPNTADASITNQTAALIAVAGAAGLSCGILRLRRAR